MLASFWIRKNRTSYIFPAQFKSDCVDPKKKLFLLEKMMRVSNHSSPFDKKQRSMVICV